MTRTRKSAAKAVVGAIETVDLPAWGVRGLAAKIDTGARTSALHVEHVAELPGGRVAFDVRLDRRRPERRVRVEAAIRRRGRVRSTNGAIEERLFVATRLRLGDADYRVEIGLVDRGAMLYRMLLGRSALAGRFVVDPARRFLLGRRRAPSRTTPARR